MRVGGEIPISQKRRDRPASRYMGCREWRSFAGVPSCETFIKRHSEVLGLLFSRRSLHLSHKIRNKI